MESVQEWFFNWYPVFGVLFMAMLLFVFLRLMRTTIGSTKPETVKATKGKPVAWEEVQGVDAEEIGLAAHVSGIVLYELAPRQASLEDAFMELTGESIEYRAGDGAVATAGAPV